VHRAALARSAIALVDVEEAADSSGRGSVDDNGVVHAFAGSIGADDALLDLAGEQNVAKAGSDGGGEFYGAELTHRPAGEAEVVEHFEVFEERGLDVDGQSHHFTATFGGRDLGLLRWKRRYVEELRDSLAALDFHEENALAAFGQRERQRGGNRGLTGSAFTRHKVQAGLRRRLGPGPAQLILGCNHTASL
jgi:hypothetical protein